MTNNEVINHLKRKYGNLSSLDIKDNTLIYEEQSLDLTNINLEKFIIANKNLKKDLSFLTSADFFTIIKLHCQNNKPIKNINAYLKEARFFLYLNKNGLKIPVVYYLDEQNKPSIEIINTLNINELETKYNDIKKTTDHVLLSQIITDDGFTIKNYQTNLKANQETKEILKYEKTMLEEYTYEKYLLYKPSYQSYFAYLDTLRKQNNLTQAQINALNRYPRILKKGNGYLNGFLVFFLALVLGIFLSLIILYYN